MADLNKWIGAGRLTADPELKQTPNGTPVATFTVAVNGYTDKQTGKTQVAFINVVAWNSTAEFVNRYFNKGSKILIVGEIQTRSWKAQDGSMRYATEVKANEVYFTSEKKDTQTEQTSGVYSENDDTDFEEMTTDEDLPF